MQGMPMPPGFPGNIPHMNQGMVPMNPQLGPHAMSPAMANQHVPGVMNMNVNMGLNMAQVRGTVVNVVFH